MVKVRKYEAKDFDDVRFVCLNSTGEDFGPIVGEFILHTFCDYYIEHEPENCFVVDDDGRAVGYIFCAEDYDSYKEIFDKDYLPLNEHLGEERYKWAQDSTILQNKYKAEYPAHMHIDLLPEYQRMGLGHKLTDALCEHLKKKGIKGINLTMSAANKKGGGFYRKYGFTLIADKFTANVFALKL